MEKILTPHFDHPALFEFDMCISPGAAWSFYVKPHLVAVMEDVELFPRDP